MALVPWWLKRLRWHYAAVVLLTVLGVDYVRTGEAGLAALMIVLMGVVFAIGCFTWWDVAKPQ